MVGSNALRPGWTPVSILLMIVGFMCFWPLGLVMLACIIWGDRVQPRLRSAFAGMQRNSARCRGPRAGFRPPAGFQDGPATPPSTTTARGS